MNELSNTYSQLPATVDALNQFILIGKERLVAQKAKIRAIEKANFAVAAKEAALSDAQDMADILLDAEVKLGEILEANAPGFSRGNSGEIRQNPLPPDINKKQSHQAQTLAKNQEIVEQAKAEARETGEIPTASKVYTLIKDKTKPKAVKTDSDILFQLKKWWKKASMRDKRTFLNWAEEEGEV